jgi:hypothetical protein
VREICSASASASISDLEAAGVLADDSRLSGAGLRLHGEQHAAGGLFELNHRVPRYGA